MLGLCRFWCYFDMVFDGFGTNFDDFWWLGGMLEISWFSMAFRGVPELRQHGRMMVFGMLSGPHSISQTVSRSYSTCKIHHETCRNEGIRKSRMQITKIRKIKAVICPHYNGGTRRKIEQILRSLVAPLRGAGGFRHFRKCLVIEGAFCFCFWLSPSSR